MRKGIALLMALLCCLCSIAFAHDVPDLNRTGQIAVAMRFDGEAVPGGELTIYRVGEVHEDDGNFSFVPTGDFADCGYAFDNPESAALASALADLAENAAGVTAAIGEDGTAVFENLAPGLYLIVQSTAAEGYNPAAPFLVGIPVMKDGAYVYEIDASPKVELKKAPATPTPKPTTDEKLPQTGQMNWPVPVLAALGVMLFTFGWVLRFRNRHEK